MATTSSVNRMNGLATGLDTDTIVKQMLTAQQNKIDNAYKAKTKLEWQQSLYRDQILNVNNFTRKYFDILNKDSYLLSKNSFAAMKVEGLTGSAIGISSTSSAKAGDYELKVNQLAKAPTIEGTNTINRITGGKIDTGVKIDGSNNKINVKVPGGEASGYDITIDSKEYTTTSEYVAAINTALSKTSVDGTTYNMLSSKVKAVYKDDKVQFQTVETIEKTDNEFNLDIGGNKYKVNLSAGAYTADGIASTLTSEIKAKYKDDEYFKDKKIMADTDNNTGKVSFYLADSKGNKITTTEGTINEFKKGTADYEIQSSMVKYLGADTLTSTKMEADGSNNSLTVKNTIISGFNDTINIRVGTKTMVAKIEAGTWSNARRPNGTSEYTDKINAAISAAVSNDPADTTIGVAGLSVSLNNDNQVVFNSNTKNQLSVYGNGVKSIGAATNFEISMNTSNKMSTLFTGTNGEGSKVKFKINGTEFSYDFTKDRADSDKSIKTILNDIKTKTGVSINYSDSTKRFTIEGSSTGASSTLKIEDLSDEIYKLKENGEIETDGGGNKVLEDADKRVNFFSTLLNVTPTYDEVTYTGEDAQIKIKGPNDIDFVEYAKASNSIEIDGINISLKSIPKDDAGNPTSVKFTMTANTEDTVKKVKDFVKDYNELISGIYEKTSEKKQYTYEPLTEEQKENMTEKQIEKWEEKAKQGLLKGDTNLNGMLSKLRTAFFSKVEGTSITLSEIGLSTSSDYTKQGQIILDEDKLTKALTERGDEVADFFAKQSTSYPTYYSSLNTEQRSTRYNESGVFQRLNDIVKDYVRTTDGKGILVQKAGLLNDSSAVTNTISKSIQEKEDLITELNKKYTTKETALYKQFTNLETAMNSLNSQLSYLTSMLGGNQ